MNKLRNMIVKVFRKVSNMSTINLVWMQSGQDMLTISTNLEKMSIVISKKHHLKRVKC